MIFITPFVGQSNKKAASPAAYSNCCGKSGAPIGLPSI
jgi:hypothetical protein